MRAHTRQVLGSAAGMMALVGLNVAAPHLSYGDPFSPFNPALGAGAALLLLGGPWLAIAVLAGQVAGAWASGWLTPMGTGPWAIAASCLTPLLLGLAARRFLDPDLLRWTVRQVLLLISSALAVSVAVVLALIPLGVPGLDSPPVYFRLGVGTATGAILGLSAVPVAVLSLRTDGWPLARRRRQARWGEFLGHAAFTLAVGAAAFLLHGPTGERFWSLYFIPLLWTVFRFEMPGAVVGLLLMGVEGIALAHVVGTPLSTLTNFHFFFFNFTATGFLLAAALQARREAELAKAEGDRRLREEVAFRAQLLENVGEAVVGTDDAGRVLFWNAAAERMFGIAREQALGSSVEEAVRYDHTSAPGLTATLRAGQRWSGEVVVRRRDGSQLHALATTVPLDTADGHGGYVGVWRDVTGKRELEAQLAQAQKMDAIGRLAGGVAHDFNNLLTVVHFNAREAAALAEGDAELAPLIEGIKQAADRASAMTRQLLSFTRAKEYRRKVLVVSDVVSGLEKMLRRLLGERVQLLVTSESAGRVRGDVGQLEQVIVNLAVNARDAMPDGGVLRIHTDTLSLDGAAARRRDLEPGEFVRLQVIDEGVGMDRATLSRAFEPFFTTKPIGEGTGLGLSTAYAMVRQAGGQLWAESVPGRGTIVSILLPESPPGEDEEEPAAAPELVAAPGRTGTVLVVEDEERVAAVAQRALTRAGYQVLKAEDGHVALGILRERPAEIDLMLTDVVMPRMTGPELVKQVRAFRPDLPIVLMSGYTNDMLEPVAPPCSFLPKPFGPGELLQAVQEYLGRA